MDQRLGSHIEGPHRCLSQWGPVFADCYRGICRCTGLSADSIESFWWPLGRCWSRRAKVQRWYECVHRKLGPSSTRRSCSTRYCPDRLRKLAYCMFSTQNCKRLLMPAGQWIFYLCCCQHLADCTKWPVLRCPVLEPVWVWYVCFLNLWWLL